MSLDDEALEAAVKASEQLVWVRMLMDVEMAMSISDGKTETFVHKLYAMRYRIIKD